MLEGGGYLIFRSLVLALGLVIGMFENPRVFGSFSWDHPLDYCNSEPFCATCGRGMALLMVGM